MEKELCACRYCKCQAAETYKVGDLWYVRCKGTKKCTRKNKDGVVETFYKKCDSWAPYEFLGLKEQDAIDNWNERNSGNYQKDEI